MSHVIARVPASVVGVLVCAPVFALDVAIGVLFVRGRRRRARR